MLFIRASVAQQPKVSVINEKNIHISNLLWDLKALSKPPEVKWIDQKHGVHALLFKALNYEGKPTEVFAYYSNPDLIKGLQTSGAKYPGIVLVHGGGGRAFPNWVAQWAKEGYAAIAMDLSGRNGDGKRLTDGGPDQTAENKFQKISTVNLKDMWPYHAVADVILAHSLLLSMPEVDTSKTCITGISWGGYLTCIVASLDSRFKAAAPVYGCGYYDETDVFGEFLHNLTPGDRKKWIKNFDPSNYLSFAPERFLFINGNQDKYYTLVPYHKTYGLVPHNRRTICIKPGMSHSHESGWAPPEIAYFFKSVLGKGTPLISVDSVFEYDANIQLFYHSSIAVSKAMFYYSNDVTSSNEHRKWSVQKATIDTLHKKVISNQPKGTFQFGFFYLEDVNHMSVSSEFIINSPS